MNRSPDDEFAVRCNAYHEAGHAVAGIVSGFRVLDIDIRPVFVPGLGNTYGSANLALPSPQEFLGKGNDAVMPLLVVLLAGVFAEQRINAAATLDTGHAQSDGQRAMTYAAGAICTPVLRNDIPATPGAEVMRKMSLIEECLEQGQLRAKDLVTRYAAAIDAVAEALISAKILLPAEVERLIATATARQAAL